MKIALVPNDDGYGPSGLGFYVAKAILRQGASLVIRNESALNLNASFYKDEISHGRVSLQPAFGGIRLRKTAEGVDIPASLRDIRRYPTRSANYVIPEDVDAVVDIGTPSAARAAWRADKPAITVGWFADLSLMCRSQSCTLRQPASPRDFRACAPLARCGCHDGIGHGKAPRSGRH